jgi:hypothetical protein
MKKSRVESGLMGVGDGRRVPWLELQGKLTEVQEGDDYVFEVGGVPLCCAIDDVVKASRNKRGQATYGKVLLTIAFYEAEAR